MKMTRAIEPQIQSFVGGLSQFVPPPLLRMFDAYELESLIAGLPSIDYDDWEGHTVYSGTLTAESETVRWFWHIVRGLPTEDCVKILQFVTGSSRVPVGGFAALPGANGVQLFTIAGLGSGQRERLPTASTCFNLLKVPEYDSEETLRNRLMTAVEGTRSFDFA
eukprot:Colp12_sorted_trinity150504_noHs@20675